MIYNYELDNLTDDELNLLYLIITDKGVKEKNVDNIQYVRKEYVLRYILSHKNQFTENGAKVSQQLIKKLLNMENHVSG